MTPCFNRPNLLRRSLLGQSTGIDDSSGQSAQYSSSSLPEGTHTCIKIKYSYICTYTYTTNNYNLTIDKKLQHYTIDYIDSISIFKLKFCERGLTDFPNACMDLEIYILFWSVELTIVPLLSNWKNEQDCLGLRAVDGLSSNIWHPVPHPGFGTMMHIPLEFCHCW